MASKVTPLSPAHSAERTWRFFVPYAARFLALWPGTELTWAPWPVQASGQLRLEVS